MVVITLKATKPQEWGFTLPLKARLKASRRPKWGFTLPLKAKLPQQTKLKKVMPLKVRSSPRHQPDKQGFTLPLRANMAKQLEKARPLDRQVSTIVALLGVQLISHPKNCTIKVGQYKASLEPFTEQKLTELRQALSKKGNSVSVLFRF
jgi:hypothetical protein